MTKRTTKAAAITGTGDEAKAAVTARITSLGFRQIGKAGTLCYVEPDADADFAGMLEFIELQNAANNDDDDIALSAALMEAIGTPADEATAAVNAAIRTLTGFTCQNNRKFTHEHNPKWNTFRNKKRAAIYVLWFPNGESPKAKSRGTKPASAKTKTAAKSAASTLLARLTKAAK